jgi:carboxylesterase
MGDYLNQQGLTCLGIRLAGHATTPEDMIASRWTDWTASVEDAFFTLKAFTDRIYFIGLSMGGVLSLLMSARLDVRGVVAISTPYRLRADPRLKYIKLISRFKPYMPKSNEPPGTGWFDKDAWKGHVSYPQNPVRSIGELNQLLGAMQAALPQVTAPVLLVHSKDDRYVAYESMDLIYNALAQASEKTRLSVTGSGHVVTRDAARQQVFEEALKFIQHVEQMS